MLKSPPGGRNSLYASPKQVEPRWIRMDSWGCWLPITSPPASQKDVQELILNPMIPSLTLPLKNSSPKAIMELQSFEHLLPVFLTESQQWIWRGRRCGIGNKQKKAWKSGPECYFWNWVTWDKHPPSISSELYILELCFPTFKLWIKVTILNVVKKVCIGGGPKMVEE